MAVINNAAVRGQQGSVLIVVLAVLGISSLLLADTIRHSQNRLQSELERSHLTELQIVAKSVFAQAAIELEQHYSEGATWPAQWQVPTGIEPRVELVSEPCPESYPGQCYKINLTLYGRGNTSLQRSQQFWGEPGCGSAWLNHIELISSVE